MIEISATESEKGELEMIGFNGGKQAKKAWILRGHFSKWEPLSITDLKQ